MSALESMTPEDVAAWVSKAGAVLVEKDPVRAAATFAALNEKSDGALGEKVVSRRMGVAIVRAREVEVLTRRIANRHALTVAALKSETTKDHIVHAKRHIAHALRHRLHLSYKDIGRVMGNRHHTTAMRMVREWSAYLRTVK